MTIKTKAILCCIAAIACLDAPRARAEIFEYSLETQAPLRCTYSAYALEARIRKIAEVRQVDFDFSRNRIIVTMASGSSILFTRLLEAIRQGGFTARDVHVRARGTLRGSGDWLSLMVDTSNALRLRGGTAIDQLEEMMARPTFSASTVVDVRGKATLENDRWFVTVDEVEEQGHVTP